MKIASRVCTRNWPKFEGSVVEITSAIGGGKRQIVLVNVDTKNGIKLEKTITRKFNYANLFDPTGTQS